MKIDWGRMTDDEMIDALECVLREVPDNDGLRLVVAWLKERDLVDELIANLE